MDTTNIQPVQQVPTQQAQPQAPAAPQTVQPVQPPQQRTPTEHLNMTVTEALYALVCYTYINASKVSFETIDKLDPSLVVVNTLANPEIVNDTKQVEDVAKKNDASSDVVEPYDNIFRKEEAAAEAVPPTV